MYSVAVAEFPFRDMGLHLLSITNILASGNLVNSVAVYILDILLWNRVVIARFFWPSAKKPRNPPPSGVPGRFTAIRTRLKKKNLSQLEGGMFNHATKEMETIRNPSP